MENHVLKQKLNEIENKTGQAQQQAQANKLNSSNGIPVRMSTTMSGGKDNKDEDNKKAKDKSDKNIRKKKAGKKWKTIMKDIIISAEKELEDKIKKNF